MIPKSGEEAKAEYERAFAEFQRKLAEWEAAYPVCPKCGSYAGREVVHVHDHDHDHDH